MRRRVIRYSLVGINVTALVAVSLLLVHNPHSQAVNGAAVLGKASPTNSVLAGPLDQLSSADIAVTAAHLVSLSETTAVTNQAETVHAELAVAPTSTTVAAKPQVVATTLKSAKDIKQYVSQPGDTISSLAVTFGVTSNSIKWSNNLVADTLSPGTSLVIPPVNGIVYTVKAGDTAQSLAQKYSANADQITAMNDSEITGVYAGQQIIIPNGQVATAAPVVLASPYSGSGFAWGGSAPIYGSNGYDYGFCTWYVASQISVPANWGNASSWAYYAGQSGWTVSGTPQIGAIAQTPFAAGGEGHVAIVDDVSPDGSQIKIRDMNGIAGWGRVGYSDWLPASKYPHYIYR